MTSMLKTVVSNGTGRAANIGKPAAGKTGTTDDSKDACFMGYTPNIVAGVWVGNDDNSRNGNIQGGTIPALIWRDVMRVATQPYGNVDFQYTSYDLTPFKAGSKAIKIISPDAVQKAFDKKEKELKKKNDDNSDYADETPIESAAPKSFLKQTTKKETKKPTATPTPIPQPEKAPEQVIEEASKLAPIPMASPF